MKSNKIIRIFLGAFGILDILLFVFSIHHNWALFAFGPAAFVVAMTNSFRQCPLLLGVRKLIYRLKAAQSVRG